MGTRLTILAGLAISAALTAPAHSDALSDAVGAMPPEVEDVRVAGAWERESDGRHGTYRIIITRTPANPVAARLFVQWLAFDDSGTQIVEHSVEIPDVAELEADIADYRAESDADGLAVYLDLIVPGGHAVDTYELFMFAPDDYLFGPATN